MRWLGATTPRATPARAGVRCAASGATGATTSGRRLAGSLRVLLLDCGAGAAGGTRSRSVPNHRLHTVVSDVLARLGLREALSAQFAPKRTIVCSGSALRNPAGLDAHSDLARIDRATSCTGTNIESATKRRDVPRLDGVLCATHP
jgi:hypothetical protein